VKLHSRDDKTPSYGHSLMCRDYPGISQRWSSCIFAFQHGIDLSA